MTNGGETASRGFIFQAVVALIECLDPKNDWDQIKNEPNTKEDKVDIMLYKDGNPRSAIQVKSSINAFEGPAVERWLKRLKDDAEGAETVCLYLVGDKFTQPCEILIKENLGEILKVPFGFDQLKYICTGKLVGYINRIGIGSRVAASDLDPIAANLFWEVLNNSIFKEPVSRKEFEAAFQNAIPQGEELAERIAKALSGMIQEGPTHPHPHPHPHPLTPIPFINKETGLVGRDEVVKDIRKMLEENTCIVLVNGLGGIGKTAVMQGICNDLKDEGHYVAWVRCGDSLQDDLLMLRDGLRIPKEEKEDSAYGMVKAGIQNLGKKMYLFMDDLSREVTREERDEINGLGVHVMITSRAENLPFRNKKLDFLDEDSAVRMFCGYYGGKSGNEETVRRIVRSVNSHTLLVELLAKAAKEEGGALDEFYVKLDKDGFFYVSEEEVEIEHDDENRTIEECVIRLYRISGLSKEQQRIMKFFSIFSPEKEIYHKVRDWAGFDRKEMKKLTDLGWLERGGLEKGYFIHQIVKDSVAKQMEKDRETVILEEYGEFLERVKDTNSYMDKAVPYEYVRERLVLTEDVARFFDESGRADEAAGTLFNNMAGIYYVQGNYGKALEYYEKACAIREKVLGKGHPYTATTYNNMALVYDAQGNYEKALEYNKKALAIKEKVLGEAHPSIATTYNNMALVYKTQGNYERALEYYEKDLAISEKVLGKAHPDTAATYNNMAGIYYVQGNYEKALEYNKKALAISEKVLGKAHPDTAATYNNMALVYDAQGNYGKALEYNKKALAIREKVLGEAHPDTATTYNNMALVYYAQGNYGKALEYNEKACAIREKVLGEAHPDTAATYNNMAEVHRTQGNYERALEYNEKALAIREKVLGKAHPSTAITYNNMAHVYSSQKNYEKALEYFKKAHQVFLSVFGEDHPNTQNTVVSIMFTELLQKTGMTEDELMKIFENLTTD